MQLELDKNAPEEYNQQYDVEYENEDCNLNFNKNLKNLKLKSRL